MFGLTAVKMVTKVNDALLVVLSLVGANNIQQITTAQELRDALNGGLIAWYVVMFCVSCFAVL
jgi:hypothetical protein